jgi:hypothetical protein
MCPETLLLRTGPQPLDGLRRELDASPQRSDGQGA